MTPAEALGALDALAADCDRCAKLKYLLGAEVREHKGVAIKAARDTRGRDWTTELNKSTDRVADKVRWVEEHLAEPHDTPRARVVPAPVQAKTPDERPECPRCGTKVQVNDGGQIRRHHGRSGMVCPRRLLTVPDVSGENLPPVVLPRSSRTPARSASEASRLDAGSTCEDCGRWLPGERDVCGRCYVRRDQERSRTA